MTDDPTQERRSERLDYSRRGYLAGTGVIGLGLLGGGTRASGTKPRPSGNPAPSRAEAGSREDFVWLGAGLWQDERMRENLFAFARRHGLAVVLVGHRSPGESEPEDVRVPMEAASEYGLDVWLNVGLLKDVPAATFVADREAREGHLEWLQSVATLHGNLFDGGRIVLWQEAPVMGQWVEGGAWTRDAVENLLEFGPAIFAAQQEAIAAANDALDVGLFVHFPYIVDSKRPDVFPALVDGIHERGAEPAFAFTDFYRGWYEKDVGPERANDAVRSLVTNARAALDDRPVFYLGQSHTINPNHTPSQQAMRMNLRASLEAGAAGLGWYVRNGYVPTERGFDPFVPNVAGAEMHSDSVSTLTVARDRFLYPWLATFAANDGFDADDAFDLWLVGDAFGLYDHHLSLRTAGGEWVSVGDVGGTADGDYPPDSAVTKRATIFRALDRDRFLADGTLECRIGTREGAPSATLEAILAMPCDPTAYVSEMEAADLVLDGADLEPFALGRMTDEGTLVPGETRTVTLPITSRGGPSLQRLRHPDWIDALDRLASFEERADVEPAARFDLWVSGDGVGASTAERPAVPALRDRTGTRQDPAADGVVASSERLVLCQGLDRERFLDGDGLTLVDQTSSAATACYAMPYAGTATFRSPTDAATLLAEQPGEAKTFSLDYVEFD